jgi:flagellar biosynthesis/type III secretory pathway protein FliH
MNQATYTNMEILNLVAVALAYNCNDATDPIIRASNEALHSSWVNGRKHGYEEGYRAGQAADAKAEATAKQVIEGLCRRV